MGKGPLEARLVRSNATATTNRCVDQFLGRATVSRVTGGDDCVVGGVDEDRLLGRELMSLETMVAFTEVPTFAVTNVL
jgi:hypothetical protein